MKLKDICCIGAGYVGGTTMLVMADKCPDLRITVVDISETVVNRWNSDDLPISEPGLNDLVHRTRGRNLFFSTDIDSTIRDAELIFICVDTPTRRHGTGQARATDMSKVLATARRIARVCNEDDDQSSGKGKIVVEKSTVPLGAAKVISNLLNNLPGMTAQDESINGGGGDQNGDGFTNGDHVEMNGDLNNDCHRRRHVVLSNPEFLAEGNAVNDLLQPDRVLIGGDGSSPAGRKAIAALSSIYSQWVPEEKILHMSSWSSELAKLAANAFLAQRVSSINSIALLCQAGGADIRDVGRAIGSDHRIGSHFLQPSLGFGGSCFNKDVLSLTYIAECLNLPAVASYWQSVLDLNTFQLDHFFKRIQDKFNGSLARKRIAVFGFTFKAQTHDTRESRAINLCNELLQAKARLSIFEPQVSSQRILDDLTSRCGCESVSESVDVCETVEQAVSDAHAIVICTEWPLFKDLDYRIIFNLMRPPRLIFDGRLLLDHQALKKIGFDVNTIGIGNPMDVPFF